METPVVSVLCMAYNHEKYIAKALDGMLAQKTSFPYEIIVHDDASTDGTAAIIREYAEKYPDIIRPIFQTENQYSKEPKIIRNFMIPASRGKYIAKCEGDDYWIDADKLQMQVDALEQRPECLMCTHALKTVVADTEEVILENHYMDHDGCLDPGKVIQDIQSPQTATFLYRRSVWDNFPDFFLDMSIGDYPRRVYCAVNGGIYYINKVMSCYRKFTAGSWTSGLQNKSPKAKKNIEERLRFLKRLDDYTGGKYHGNIQVSIDEYEFSRLMRFGSLREAVSCDYFKKKPVKQKIKLTLTYRWPKLWYKLVVLRMRLTGARVRKT